MTASPVFCVLSTILYIHAGRQLIAQSDGTTTEYFHQDGLGSVRQMTNALGSVLLAQTFDPYGNPYLSAAASGADSAYGWAGEQRDGNGLVFLRARYYNPSLGRFLNVDPSRREANPYRYSYNNPLNFTDPSGLDPHWCEDAPDPDQCYKNYSPWYKSIPLVNDDGSFPAKYTYDWYGAQAGESIFLSVPERREMAAQLAMKWAPLSWEAWEVTGSEVPLDESGNVLADNCFDCTRFVSYILWRVGFRMVGRKTFRPDGTWYFIPSESAWYANLHISGGESPAWAQVIAFRDFWKAHGAIEVKEENFNQLQKGDVILYNYDDWPPAAAWDHAAMVVDPVSQGLDRPYVASRGNGNCVAEDNPPYVPYDEVLPSTWTILEIVGLKMPY